MPLSYPLASDARSALAAETLSRTASEAKERAGEDVVLVSEWLRPSPADHAALKVSFDAGVGHGFVQVYEDKKGRPVIAVTFWKRKATIPAQTPEAPVRRGARATAPAADPAPAPKKRARSGARKDKDKGAAAASRQLDLFAGPDQGGAETPDPHNPGVVLVEEEGDGATFGLATEAAAKPRPRRPRESPKS